MGYGTAAISGFIEGFAGTMAKDINERKSKATDFFEKQVEYARTTGLANRQKVKDNVNANMSIANQLQAVGVPKEIIMAQVNMDPDSLGDLHTQAEKIRASSGKDFTPEEWKAIFKVAEDFKAPDEDLTSFISRTFDPIANAAKSPEFEDDPEASIIASMMGYNAMDKARSSLKTTMIAEGMSADDLIRYGDSRPQRVGGPSTVTTNYAAVPTTSGQLSFTDVGTVNKLIADKATPLITKLQSDTGVVEGQDATGLRDQLVEHLLTYPVDKMTPALAKHMVETYLTEQGLTFSSDEDEEKVVEPGDIIETPIPEPLEGGVEDQVELPPDMGSPETPTPPEAPPVELTEEDAPIDPREELHLNNLPPIKLEGEVRSLAFAMDNANGTSTWIDESGKLFTLPNKIVRQFGQPQ